MLRARNSRFVVLTSIICGLFLALGISFGIGIASRWPFTRQEAAKTLSENFASRVEFGTFHPIWLPHPGFDANRVTLTPTRGLAAGSAQISTMHVEADWLGLLRHRVRRVAANGIAVYVRSLGDGAFAGHAGDTVIERAELRDATFQVGPPDDGQSFRFHEVDLSNVGHGIEATYRIAVAIPRPAGDLELHGKLGPLVSGQVSNTPISGSYRFTHADLSVFKGISGTLSSTGDYSGRLAQLDFKGQAAIPDFAVKENRHTHRLSAQFRAIVNGANGNTNVPSLQATIDQTKIESAAARIEGSEPAKTILLKIASARGRIQDLMLLFIKAPQSPMLGPIAFRAQITLPPGPRPFKKRVTLDGIFGISGAGFTDSVTQAKADELSERAEGEPRDAPERVLSDLSGHVVLRDGVATFSELSFHVPAATAHLSGTFNLVSERIDLHGKLVTQAELSKTTTGIKSVFLKLLDPVFKGRRAGAVIPVSLGGTYDQPTFHEVMTK